MFGMIRIVGAPVEMVAIDPQDLKAAQERDQNHDT